MAKWELMLDTPCRYRYTDADNVKIKVYRGFLCTIVYIDVVKQVLCSPSDDGELSKEITGQSGFAYGRRGRCIVWR
jgi:hypothetical protein